MAYASITYTSASGTTFALTNSSGDPIEYLRQADISVTVNGVLKTLTTDYTFNAAGTAIVLNTAVSGATVVLSRTTSITDATVSFTAGSTLTAQDLNNSDKQNRFALQEFSDTYGAITTGTGDLSVLGGFIGSAETWLSDNSHAATTGAIDGRVDSKIDTALTTDVVAGNAITITDNSPSSGQITVAVTNGAIETAELADGAVTTAKIADGNVTTAKILDSNVTTAKLNDAAVTTAKLANDSVTSAKIADGTIIAGDLANDAVTTAKILDANVTTAKIADSNVTTAKINNAAVTEDKLANSAVTNAKIASGAIDSTKLSGATVVTNAEVSGVTVNDTSFFTTSASDLRYFRQDSSEAITSGDAWSSSDSYVATTAAIDARIIDLVDDVGGFVPIANETSFPATNPDINNPDGAGTIISIKEIVTTRTPSSGTVTIANGSGSNTVTINGCGSTVLASGFGVLVETTSTLHTYTFHRLVPKATEVTTVAGISTQITTVSNNVSDITTVANDLNEPTSEIETVAGSIANVDAVGGSIANVNTVASNLTAVNSFANLYRIASSDPTTSLDTGDLVFNTTSNRLRVYNGTAWQDGVTATGDLVSKTGDTMTGALGITSGSAGSPSLFISGDTNTGIYSPGADQVAISTGGSGRLFVDANGRLGVGSSSPQSRLEIAQSADNTDGPKLRIANNGNTLSSGQLIGGIDFFDGDDSGEGVGAYIYSYTTDSIGRASGQDLRFGTGESEKMRLTSTGALGLGTSSPVSLLDVSGGSSTGGITFSGSVAALRASSGVLDLGDDTRLMAVGANTSTAGTINLVVASSDASVYRNALTVASSGNVGIGTTSPARGPLHVHATSGESHLHLTNADTGSTGSDGFSVVAMTATDNREAWLIQRENAAMRFYTNSVQRAVIDSSGNVGIGTDSPFFSNGDGLEIQRDGTACLRLDNNTDSKYGEIYVDSTGLNIDARGASAVLNFDIGGSTKATLDNSGRLLVGTSSTSVNHKAIVQGNGEGFCLANTSSAPADGDALSYLAFTSNNHSPAASVIARRDGGTWTNGSSQPTRLVFATTADSESSPTERMRITNNGTIMIGNTSDNPGGANIVGTTFGSGGSYLSGTRDSSFYAVFNRKTNDGDILLFAQDGTTEGTISVSGTTVQLNGAHLSRWSQLLDGGREEILRGTVLSNLDELCEWGEEDNEQLNRMKVSDVEGDPNVAGVFVDWDNDDDTYTDDFYCAMTGDFIIRIAEGVTVQRGDLLMSAGDGTAKPQDDDIVRSKTVAKVTSTHVTCTYDDGSYCVPCVLMAC